MVNYTKTEKKCPALMKRLDSCIKSVEKKGGVDNPIAVCRSKVKKTPC